MDNFSTFFNKKRTSTLCYKYIFKYDLLYLGRSNISKNNNNYQQYYYLLFIWIISARGWFIPRSPTNFWTNNLASLLLGSVVNRTKLVLHAVTRGKLFRNKIYAYSSERRGTCFCVTWASRRLTQSKKGYTFNSVWPMNVNWDLMGDRNEFISVPTEPIAAYLMLDRIDLGWGSHSCYGLVLSLKLRCLPRCHAVDSVKNLASPSIVRWG